MGVYLTFRDANIAASRKLSFPLCNENREEGTNVLPTVPLPITLIKCVADLKHALQAPPARLGPSRHASGGLDVQRGLLHF
jgi:hypothetical protein